MSDDTLIDTGLSGATANQPAPAPVIAPAAPVPAPTLPDGWTIGRASEFIGDLATNMYDLDYVLAKHHVTRQQYDAIKDNPFFVTTLEAFAKDWHKPDSVNRRLALKAAIIVEDAMPTVATRLGKASEPLTGIVELLKLYCKIAGLGDNSNAHAQTHERFQININLGADVEHYDKALQVREVQSLPEGQGAEPAVQPIAERANALLQLLKVPEGV